MTLPEVLPARHPDVEIAEFDTEFVVFDPRCNDVHRMVGLTAVVFDACDGVTTLASLVGEVASVLETSDQQALTLIEQALAEITRVGALQGSEPLKPPP